VTQTAKVAAAEVTAAAAAAAAPVVFIQSRFLHLSLFLAAS